MKGTIIDRLRMVIAVKRSSIKTALGYTAGLLSGMLIIQACREFLQRDGLPGGEVLVIPMIILLLAFGWDMGKERGYQEGNHKGFNEGFEEGYYEASGLYFERSVKDVR